MTEELQLASAGDTDKKYQVTVFTHCDISSTPQLRRMQMHDKNAHLKDDDSINPHLRTLVLCEDEPSLVFPDEPYETHIVMQAKKALDVGGNYYFMFKDGTKCMFPLVIVQQFIWKYSSLKPRHREEMQSLAEKSRANFVETLTMDLQ